MDEREQQPDEETLDLDVAEFARAWDDEEGSEVGLAGGSGDLGAGGDLSGDRGGLDPQDDEGMPT